MRLSAPPKVSIVIPHYGRRGTLLYLLRSVLESEYPKDKLEVIVVTDDEKSVEDILSKTEFALINSKILRRSLWFSVSNARNIGGLQASGDIIAFIDDDIILTKEALARLVSALLNEPGAGCVRPAIYLYSSKCLQTLGIKFYKTLGLLRAKDIKIVPRTKAVDIDAGEA